MGKYFKYAIGEILLVVIGILIALQINNWNQTRKDRIKEAGILKQINRDFKSNKRQMDSIKENYQMAVEASNKIVQLLPFKRDKAVIDSLIKYSPQVFSVKTFNPSSGSVNALINSSTFDLIENDSLRNLLVSWNDVYLDYREEEQYHRDLHIWEVQAYFRDNLNYLNPYTESNLDVLVTNKMQNLLLDYNQSVKQIIDAIRDEGIEIYINEVIRLTNNNE